MARVAVAGMTVWMAGIHLHLWNTGYRHIHIIGVLFLLNAIIGTVLAVSLLVIPSRMLGAAAAATTLFIAGTLVGLILSLTVGLFGFKEFSGAPFFGESVYIEAIGLVLGAALSAIYARGSLAWGREFYQRARPASLANRHAQH